MTALGILCVFAHPDDESFGCGGALAGYAMRGTPVDVLCATRGQAGQLGDPPVTTHAGLGAVREVALRAAMQLLGFRDLFLLDFEDGQLVDAPPETFAAQVMEILRRVRPTTVITFGPHGINGHPDHIATHVAATTAFARLRDEMPELQRLYYPAVPRQIAVAMNREIPGPEGTPNTELPVPPEALEAQIAALAKHGETQADARGMRERLIDTRPTVAYLYRAEPPMPDGATGRELLP